MKIIAFYLPQFHEIPENDEWWGKGFTEWVNVRRAKPLFPGHAQPRIPLNGDYYDLLSDGVARRQAELAKQYGIYGFCYYHYWFNGKLVLEKPMERMLADPGIDLPFCICWANEPWTKAWVGGKEVLLPQFYGGEEEWTEHYRYLSPFLHDSRYICEDGMPLLVIYRAEVIPRLNEMLELWRRLAVQDGFKGLKFAYQDITFDKLRGRDDSAFDYNIEFQPIYAWWDMNSRSALKGSRLWARLRSAKRKAFTAIERRTGFDMERRLDSKTHKGTAPTLLDYDEVWQTILACVPESEKNLPGAFVSWDNSPRKGMNSRVSVGDDPEKFEHYLTQQIRRARGVYGKDYLFMYAWNEWAEGGYLEPDERFRYGNLQAIRNALDKTGENPWSRGGQH